MHLISESMMEKKKNNYLKNINRLFTLEITPTLILYFKFINLIKYLCIQGYLNQKLLIRLF